MKNILYNEINIRVGQNAKENDYLVRNSHPEFTWIHLKSYPSGHVIVETQSINDELLNYASKLCLQGTKQKKMKDICVSVSKIKNLKVTETLGEVEFKSNKRVITKKIVFT